MITYEKYAEFRNAKGYKDSDICRMTGIPQSTFSEWKNGKYTPKYDKMSKIAEALEMNYNDFVGVYGKFSALNKKIPMLQQATKEVKSSMVPMLNGMNVLASTITEDPAMKELQRKMSELAKQIPTLNVELCTELIELFHNATDDAQNVVITLLKKSQKDK